MEINKLLNRFEKLIAQSNSEYDAEFPSGNLIFRGQVNADRCWKLLPKIFRPEYIQCEKKLINRYNLRYNIGNQDYISNISDMQHYGMPTKLLDWSSNILVALFFAVCDESFDNKDARLFILDTNSLSSNIDLEVHRNLLKSLFGVVNITDVKDILDLLISDKVSEYTTQERRYPDDSEIDKVFETCKLPSYNMLDINYKKKMFEILTKPILIIPQSINPRIAAQQSLFTYHFGGAYEMLNTIEPFNLSELLPTDQMNENNKYDLNMACITIPASAKRVIRYELSTYFNINIATIYPDDKEKVLSQDYSIHKPLDATNGGGEFKLAISSIY